MGKKAEVGTPKWLANKMKSKGLQRLRWFCQMCQKQCRDENGFKCHTSSESHQRQLLLFADNPGSYLNEFSRDFERGYLELLRRRFGGRRVHANVAYQEYIGDKLHVHMNATVWETLTGFVKYLGRTGKCTVDETERGWFVTYIDRDPETIAKQAALERRKKIEKDDEERAMEFLQKQVEKARSEASSLQAPADYTELRRTAEGETIKLDMCLSRPSVESRVTEQSAEPQQCAEPIRVNVFAIPTGQPPTSRTRAKSVVSSCSSGGGACKRKISALEEIKSFEESKKESKNRKNYWLSQGIVVKIMTQQLGDDFYKKKAIVCDVIDNYVGVVKLLSNGKRLKLDQNDLETVIPAIGRKVKIVNGAYRDTIAVLETIHADKFSAVLSIAEGTYTGRTLNDIAYEDFSKLHVT